MMIFRRRRGGSLRMILIPLLAAALQLPGYSQEKNNRTANAPATPAEIRIFSLLPAHAEPDKAPDPFDTIPEPMEIRIPLAPVPASISRSRGGDTEETLFTASLLTMAALHTADYLSTRKALSYPGAYEANPLLRPFADSRWALPAVKFGLTITNHLLLRELHKKNKTLAWVVSIVGNLALSYAVSHNLRTIDSLRNR